MNRAMNGVHWMCSQAMGKSFGTSANAVWVLMLCAASMIAPELAFAGGPFSTGATGLQTNVLTILTPIAVVAVMALGAAAWFQKISWGWAVGGMLGMVLVFGAPQIVAWVRTMFSV